MLATLMALATMAAAQAEPLANRQDDPHDPWIIGPWRLACGRDGNLSGWNYVETCGATAAVGDVQLFITRSATEAHTAFTIQGCDPRPGTIDLPLGALGRPGPARVRLVRKALERTIKAATDHCSAGAALKGVALRDDDIAKLLDGSDGLRDLRRPGA